MSLPLWMQVVQWAVIVLAGTGFSLYTIRLARAANRQREIANFKQLIAIDARYLASTTDQFGPERLDIHQVGQHIHLPVGPEVLHSWYRRRLAQQARALRRARELSRHDIESYVAITVLRQGAEMLAVQLYPVAAESSVDAYNQLAPHYSWPLLGDLADDAQPGDGVETAAVLWVIPNDRSIVLLVPCPARQQNWRRRS